MPCARVRPFFSRAFTLVEVAIVLGILGLVTAAIYVAWGASRTAPITEEVTGNLGHIVENVRSYYAGHGKASDALAEPLCKDEGGAGDVLTAFKNNVRTGIFPVHLIEEDKKEPKNVFVRLCDTSTTSPQVPQIYISYMGIPEFACRNIVHAASYAGVNMKLSKIVVRGKTPYAFTLLTPAGAPNAADTLNVDPASGMVRNTSTKLGESCIAPDLTPGSVTIDFYYKLRP